MMKESDLAYCGLNCSKCPVLIATTTCDILKGFYSFDVHLPAKYNLDRIRSGR